jgi:uncharacterized protein YbbC (DUF1343 family)
MNVMSKTKPIPFCFVLFALNLLFFAPFALTAKPSIKLGVDFLEETGFEVLKGKRVGLLTHPAGKNGRGQSTVEVLFRSRVVNLVALFGPEHGIYGDEKASVPVDDKIYRLARLFSLRKIPQTDGQNASRFGLHRDRPAGRGGTLLHIR